ncbi:WD40 repeat-like protein [Epithele typhae]|uniref:WD40 repeat-like protein n=1 Tax=Epithele typhae TaxID=378194 RepID=UPI0020074363|nr:WD40 repeat-like protein [Epithele typhae]KAH9927959.1 WD40 repeat-like protein [Epithele typhae]
MPDIPVGAQIFDLAFHPTEPLVLTGLLTGHLKAFGYDEQGNYEEKFSIRPSKKSCRTIAMSADGARAWAGGKAKAIHIVDVGTGVVVETRAAAHDVPINRMKRLTPHLFASGDDDGVVKLWDPRQPEAVRAYTHHFDFISDFMWLPDKKQLVATSGDGTLSVMDVRSKKTEPAAQSEDQEDELLSILPIKGGEKIVVGTQIGILSVFNRKKGWGDCVDRIPGHPQSIDALCAVPSRYPNAQMTILTGSSDGLLRAVQLFPTKMLGVVADHGEFPIERIAVDLDGEGRWVGSVGHEEVLKLTDLQEVFEDEDPEGSDDEEDGKSDADGLGSGEHGSEDDAEDAVSAGPAVAAAGEDTEDMEDAPTSADTEVEADKDSDGEEDVDPEPRKRKRKKERDPLQAAKKKKGRNEVEAEPAFFADL